MMMFGLAGGGLAQDSQELIDAFVRKGLLSEQDVEHGRADVARAAAERAGRVLPWAKSTQRLSVGMLLMTQFSGLKTTVEHGADPESVNHFMIRRAVFVLRGTLTDEWSATFGYNFATTGLTAAVLQWTIDRDLRLDVGLRKVSLGYEEYSSPDRMRAIETAPATRYFVEANNGLRLGAASYRIGVFMAGRYDGFRYGGAITNAERLDDLSMIASAGNGSNNQAAFWADVSYAGRGSFGSYLVGAAAGILPGQGGPGDTHRGEGYDLTIGSAFADIEAGRFSLLAEYFVADVERGASLSRDAAPSGFYIQPGFMCTATLEAVVRYSWVDSDGRGIGLADAVRSAPNGGVMDTIDEWYLGGNWYVRRNDLKLSLGVLYARGRGGMDQPTLAAQTFGVRSQVQVNF